VLVAVIAIPGGEFGRGARIGTGPTEEEELELLLSRDKNPDRAVI